MTTVQSGTRKRSTLTVEDLRSAVAKCGMEGLSVKELPNGCEMLGSYAGFANQNIAYVYAIHCHDQRVKLTFSKKDNAHADAILLLKEFDKEKAFAAALRIVLGDRDSRFRHRERVLDLVQRVGVSDIARAMPTPFSEFMWGAYAAFNKKAGVDIAESVGRLRKEVANLVDHISEADIVRIYREEMVGRTHNS